MGQMTYLISGLHWIMVKTPFDLVEESLEFLGRLEYLSDWLMLE